MPISITCDGCDKKYQVKDELAGKKIRCPGCQEIITVPGGASKSATKVPAKSAVAVAKKKPAKVDFEDYGDVDDDDDFEDDYQPARRRVAKRREEEPPKKKKKKRSSGGGDVPWGLIIGGAVGALALLAFVLAFVFPAGAAVIAALILLVGALLGVIGSLGTLVRAFQEDVTCGLLYLFIPFYGLYYLVSRWDDVQPFGKCLVGGICMQFLAYGLIALNIAMAVGQANTANANNNRFPGAQPPAWNNPQGDQAFPANPPGGAGMPGAVPAFPGGNAGMAGPDGRMKITVPAALVQPVPPGHQFKKGDKVYLEWAGEWNECEVLQVDVATGHPLVHWIGWADAWDEVFPPDKIRLRR